MLLVKRCILLREKSGAVSAEQFIQKEVSDTDLSELPPAQRRLPDYMRDKRGLTYDVLAYPLHAAVAVGDYGEVARLLADNEEEEDVNGFDRRGRAPIHLAVEADDIHMVALLIRHGADINISISEERWFYKIVDRWDNGSDRLLSWRDKIDSGKVEPLVPISGNIEKLKRKECVHCEDALLTSAHLAVREKHLDILALLLLEGVSTEPIDTKHDYMRSSAHIAARNGDLSSIALLDAAETDFGGDGMLYDTNPFQLAVAYRKADVVTYLLDRMPKEEIVKAMSIVKDVSIAELILQKISGVSLDTIQDILASKSLLHSHAGRGQVGIVKLLIDKHGMDANTTNEEGNSVLFHALLFKSGEEVQEVVVALLERGADPLAISNRGNTPFDLAREEGIGHLFLPYMEGKISIPPDITQDIARMEALARYAQ